MEESSFASAAESQPASGLTPMCSSEKPSESILASRQSFSILAKSPAFTASEGTIQLPPTAKTFGQARYSVRFLGPTPPVGMNEILPP